jgi:Protein of unknown function (DUF2937).
MRVLYRYLVALLFAGGMLAGAQVPAFVDQYAKRVDASLQQARLDFAGWRQLARQFYGGDVDALIAAHAKSTQPEVRAETAPIQAQYQQLQRLEQENFAMHAPLYEQVIHILTAGDSRLLRTTWQQYGASVPLRQTALICGAITALIVVLLLELSAGLLRVGGRRLRRRLGTMPTSS